MAPPKPGRTHSGGVDKIVALVRRERAAASPSRTPRTAARQAPVGECRGGGRPQRCACGRTSARGEGARHGPCGSVRVRARGRRPGGSGAEGQSADIGAETGSGVARGPGAWARESDAAPMPGRTTGMFDVRIPDNSEADRRQDISNMALEVVFDNSSLTGFGVPRATRRRGSRFLARGRHSVPCGSDFGRR